MQPPLGRRSFLAAMGAIPASIASAARATTTQPQAHSRPRGLALASDFSLAPGLTYLQTASVGPSPRPVIDRTIAAWRTLEQNPVYQAYRVGRPILEDVRSTLAAFLHCTHDELVLTYSTTAGMNAVANAIEFSPGDRVLTTDQEHAGGRSCWEYLARRRGVVLDEVAIPLEEQDPQAVIDRFRRAMTPRTRVLSFSHILYSTGLRMPAAELCSIARQAGCLSIVDGAQVPGGTRVDVNALGCDAYATTGHKWLLGPKGTGMLFLRESARDRIQLINEQVSREAQSDSVGLLNLPAFVGLAAAVAYISSIGIERIEAHNVSLRNRLAEMLREVPQVRVVAPVAGPSATPLVTVQLPEGTDAAEFANRLRERHQVMVRPLADLPRGIRFSTHLFNSDEDLVRGIHALRSEVA